MNNKRVQFVLTTAIPEIDKSMVAFLVTGLRNKPQYWSITGIQNVEQLDVDAYKIETSEMIYYAKLVEKY